MHRIILALLAAAVATGCASGGGVRPTTITLRDVKTIALVVPDEGEFTVVKARAGTNATAAAAIGGLIGGMIVDAISSKIDRSRDAKDAESLAGYVRDFSAAGALRNAFGKTLNGAMPVRVEILAKEPDVTERQGYDAVAVLSIKSWGLKLARSEPERLSTFVELSTIMVRTGTAEKMWDEHDTVFGYGRHHLATYREDSGLLRQELGETIERVASTVAAQLLYPKEEKK